MGPADLTFTCPVFQCSLRVVVCIRRQIACDACHRGDLASNSSRRKRGLTPRYPGCFRCPVGGALRAAFGDAGAAGVRIGNRPPGPWYAWMRAQRDLTPTAPPEW